MRASSYEMTHTLVAHGAWVEQVCRKNWTAMHEAAKVGNVDILMLLLRNGGWVNHKDVTGVTPLAVAAEHGHFHITEILLNCGQSEDSFTAGLEAVESVNWSPFSGVQRSNLLLFLHSLLPSGSRVNSQACNGESVLLDAAGSGNTACIQLLLDNGADPNLPSITGHLPIHKAAYAGHYE